MKRLIHTLSALACLLATASCEKDLTPIVLEEPRLNFIYYNYNGEVTLAEDIEENMLETAYSFALRSATVGEELTIDTVWFEVGTMGRLFDYDRPVELEQISTGEADAVPGVHFVPFDDPQLLSKSFIPANQNKALIPIVVLRDASLDDGNVNLQFTFKDNGYFKPGYEVFSTHTLVISSHMAKPANWDTYYGDNNFGTYTELKHQLMIEWTGNSWDEDYLDELFAGDSNYVTYLSQWFIEKLEEENQKRQEAGLDIYREPNGEPVSFDPAPWY